jgi:Holliday junction resolvase
VNNVKPTAGNAIVKAKTPRGKPSSQKRSKTRRINSRQKGAQGEREFAEVLRTYGYKARRGQQFAGGGDSPDVVSNVPDVHFEVKRVQAGQVYKWLEQAVRDAHGKVPIVAHRRNGQDWIAVLRMDDLLKFIQGSEGPL